MRFFFPDSQDQIDPDFDFATEEHSPVRVRQRDDRYIHEVLAARTIDGVLVSKTIVDGWKGTTAKYTLAQRHRLYRVGIRRFFRLDAAPGKPLLTMGDCGAFSYIEEDAPPYRPDEVIDFYEGCGFDIGIAIDHVIFGYDPAHDRSLIPAANRDWDARQQLTLSLAEEFLGRCRSRHVRFIPMGVAQGWSPASYTFAVRELQRIGYQRIALGGMVPLKTGEILDCLKQIDLVRQPDTQLHLLGITRCNNIGTFSSFGVTSFDSTSAFRQAFKDDHDNYYTAERNYTAIRVPQVGGNASLKKHIRAGRIEQGKARHLERECLEALHGFDLGTIGLPQVLESLRAYGELFGSSKDYTPEYRETLLSAPWKTCKCGICESAGINVVLFRGSERNKRRGFHNVYALRQRLDRELEMRGVA